MEKLTSYIIGSMIFLSCVDIKKGDDKTNEAHQDKSVEVSKILSNSQNNYGINITTTGPRGGSYSHPEGAEVRYTVFRIQIVNDTIISLDLELDFPETPAHLLTDSIVLLSIFLLPDSLTPKNIQDDLNFGVIGIEKFFESDLSSHSTLKTSIQPKGQQTLYVGLKLESEIGNGTTRSILFINGQNIDAPFLPIKTIAKDDTDGTTLDLVYGIGVDPPNNYRLIPCGQIKYIN